MEVDFSQALRRPGRVLHVDEEKNSLFDPRPKVAPSNKADQYVLAEQTVQIEQEAHHEREGEKKRTSPSPMWKPGTEAKGNSHWPAAAEDEDSEID